VVHSCVLKFCDLAGCISFGKVRKCILSKLHHHCYNEVASVLINEIQLFYLLFLFNYFTYLQEYNSFNLGMSQVQTNNHLKVFYNLQF
jgi:hypothetical protein